MTKIYSTLGRKFNRKDLEDAQRMGQELVNEFYVLKLCIQSITDELYLLWIYIIISTPYVKLMGFW